MTQDFKVDGNSNVVQVRTWVLQSEADARENLSIDLELLSLQHQQFLPKAKRAG